VEGSLQNMVAQANSAGVQVILRTIAPASYCTDERVTELVIAPVHVRVGYDKR
jgi:hypothetical protein